MTDLFNGNLPMVAPPGFEALWACWRVGRKVGKFEAERAYQKALKIKGVTPEFLIERARVYNRSVEHAELRHVLHCATWLNKRRFEDEIEGPPDGGPSTTGAGRRGHERQADCLRFFAATTGRDAD